MALTARKAATAAKTLREAADDGRLLQRRKLREAAEMLERFVESEADEDDSSTETEEG